MLGFALADSSSLTTTIEGAAGDAAEPPRSFSASFLLASNTLMSGLLLADAAAASGAASVDGFGALGSLVGALGADSTGALDGGGGGDASSLATAVLVSCGDCVDEAASAAGDDGLEASLAASTAGSAPAPPNAAALSESALELDAELVSTDACVDDVTGAALDDSPSSDKSSGSAAALAESSARALSCAPELTRSTLTSRYTASCVLMLVVRCLHAYACVRCLATCCYYVLLMFTKLNAVYHYAVA